MANVTAFWVESWRLAMPHIDFAARVPWLIATIEEQCAAGARALVAEDAQGVLGFVLFDPRRAWLEQIAVAPRGLGGGASRALLGAAKQACPNGFGLDVNADNSRALTFYRREGLVKTGEGVNPRSGLPTVAMRWTPPAVSN